MIQKKNAKFMSKIQIAMRQPADGMFCLKETKNSKAVITTFVSRPKIQNADYVNPVDNFLTTNYKLKLAKIMNSPGNQEVDAERLGSLTM